MHRPRQVRALFLALLFPTFLFAATLNISCDPKVSEQTGEETTTERTQETSPEDGSPAETTTETTQEAKPEDGGTTEAIAETSPDQPNQPSVEAAATKLLTPLDATPGPNGETTYYTAMLPPNVDDPDNSEGRGALFKVTQGTPPQELAKGFVSPLNLVLSTNGQTVFVADRGQAKPEEENQNTSKTGGIYSVPSTGGPATLVPNTQGYQPRGLDLIKEGNDDVLFFSGVDPADGSVGVFKMKTTGGAISPVLKGSPLRDPSGVAAAADGKVYVADARTEDGTSSVVYQIANGQASDFSGPIRVGYPAGIALNKNEDTLLVSGLQPQTNSSVVYLIKIADKTISEFSQGISQNSESGGVHRAHNTNSFAWADSSTVDRDGNGGGTVYMIKLP